MLFSAAVPSPFQRIGCGTESSGSSSLCVYSGVMKIFPLLDISGVLCVLAADEPRDTGGVDIQDYHIQLDAGNGSYQSALTTSVLMWMPTIVAKSRRSLNLSECLLLCQEASRFSL